MIRKNSTINQNFMSSYFYIHIGDLFKNFKVTTDRKIGAKIIRFFL